MVNLLFITSNSKINGIIEALQPFLKVKIDLVADFDFGLKDVFEKRPATVFIQDQIAGVTGESVARHIQMLLGSGSPSFIFMHDGSTKAKPINGLFEHLIDLSQPDTIIVTTIKETLKAHFGPQWDKVYISPKAELPPIPDTALLFPNTSELQEKVSDSIPTSQISLNAVPPENAICSSSIEQSVNSAFESFDVVSSPQEQLAEMLSASEDKPAFAAPGKDVGGELLSNEPFRSGDEETPLQEKKIVIDAVRLSDTIKPSIQAKNSAPKTTGVSSNDSVTITGTGSVPRIPVGDKQESFQKQEPADFVIIGERLSGQVAPEDLLRVFEGGSCSSSSVVKKTIFIVVPFVLFIGAAYWFFGNSISTLNIFTKKPVKSSVATISPKPPESLQVPAKQDVVPTVPAESNMLPAFVPKSGFDSAYSSQKPGWERYVDSTMDCRLYRNAGKIKAVQVLGVHDSSIKESLLKTVLKELVGSTEFRVKSRKLKNGYNVEQAVIGQDVDLLIYRKKHEIRAFVVSLN